MCVRGSVHTRAVVCVEMMLARLAQGKHTARGDRLQVIDTPGVLDRNHEVSNVTHGVRATSLQPHAPGTQSSGVVDDGRHREHSLHRPVRHRLERHLATFA